LTLQTQIINTPLHHGFSPKRWQTVVNAMLKKYKENQCFTNCG
jgi:hypothetical protein